MTRQFSCPYCKQVLAVAQQHIGQAVMSLGGTLDYFIDTVFNYPTLAECYKAAAFNGINRLARAAD